MATGIDHVVIAVNDLDAATANFTEAGFTVTPGGEHASGGTHNALVSFSDGAYIELIAWKYPDAPSDHPWLARLKTGEGLVDVALRSADLGEEVERLRAEGLDVPDPKPGGRTRPDGERVEWMNLRFDGGRHPSLPFYCQSTNDRSLRVPSGEAAVHANGVSGIDTIFIGVADLDQAAADWRIVAGIELEATSSHQPSGNTSKRFRVGTHEVVLVHPEHDDAELAKSIARRGQVPIELAFRSSAEHGSSIEPRLSHGAKLAILEQTETLEHDVVTDVIED